MKKYQKEYRLMKEQELQQEDPIERYDVSVTLCVCGCVCVRMHLCVYSMYVFCVYTACFVCMYMSVCAGFKFRSLFLAKARVALSSQMDM